MLLYFQQFLLYFLYRNTYVIVLKYCSTTNVEVSSVTTKHYTLARMMEHYCKLESFCKMLFVLECTPPPGLTTSRVCFLSLLAHWLSHLAVGSGSVWTHMRIAPETQGLETPSLPHRSATTSFQWWGCLAHLLLGTLMLKVAYHRPMSSPWVVRGAWAQMNSNTVMETSREERPLRSWGTMNHK